MRTRQERRYLTHKYQKKQARLHKRYNGPYRDEGRRPSSVSNDTRWIEWGYESEAPGEGTLGRWRNTSAFDCGRPGCQMCCSPRRRAWGNNRERLTLQENRNQDLFDHQLAYYYDDSDGHSRGIQSSIFHTLD